MRVFRNRSLSFLRFLYKTYICAHLDYGSQIWAPTKLQEIDSLESIVRAWTRRVPTLREYHSWDRMEMMNISSVQRRQERYQVLYC